MNKNYFEIIKIIVLVFVLCIFPNSISNAVDPYATFEFNIPIMANVPINAYSITETNGALQYASCAFYKMVSGSPVSTGYEDCFELGEKYRVTIMGIPSATYDSTKPCTLNIGGQTLSVNVNGDFSRWYPQETVGYTTADPLSFTACFEFNVTKEAKVLSIKSQTLRYYTAYSSVDDEVTEDGSTINATCKIYDNSDWTTTIDEIDGYTIWHNVKIAKGNYNTFDVLLADGKAITQNASCAYNVQGYKEDDSGLDIYFSSTASNKKISIPGLIDVQAGTTKSNIETIIANALGTENCPSSIVDSITVDSLYEYQSGATNTYKIADFALSNDLDDMLKVKRYKLVLKFKLNKDFSVLNFNTDFDDMSAIGKNSFGYDDSIKPTTERDMIAIVDLALGSPRLAQVDSYYDGTKDIYAMSSGNDSSKVSFMVEGNPVTSVSWKIDGVAASATFTFEKDKVYNATILFGFSPKDSGCRVNNTDLASSYSVGDNQYFFDEYGTKGYKYCIILNYKFVCEDKPAPTSSGSKKYKATDTKDTAEKISGSGKKGSTRTITPIEGKKVSSVIVTDKDGNKIDVTLNEDGTYSFVQPASNVDVQVNYKNREITLNIGSTEASVDGETSNLDVAPILRNDRTMLPIRFVAENLGAKVGWDEKNPNYVVITRGDTKIEITLGSDIMKVNGKDVILDSVAFAENDRTYLPVRAISEALNAIVEWNETRPNEVKIYEQ